MVMPVRTLEALRSRLVADECGASCLIAGTQSSALELARLNSRIVDDVCVSVLRTLPSHAHHVSTAHSNCLSPSERLAYKASILQCVPVKNESQNFWSELGKCKPFWGVVH